MSKLLRYSFNNIDPKCQKVEGIFNILFSKSYVPLEALTGLYSKARLLALPPQVFDSGTNSCL
jgi:hypothetical protein